MATIGVDLDLEDLPPSLIEMMLRKLLDECGIRNWEVTLPEDMPLVDKFKWLVTMCVAAGLDVGELERDCN